MLVPSPVVLLIAPPGAAVPDVTAPLAEAGYAVRPVTELSATPPTAIVLLADAVVDPLAVTRTYRFQQPPTVPILWLVSRASADLAADALDAGADACLLRPVAGPLLVGQLRALVRARAATTSDELRDLTHRLQKLYEQTERERSLSEQMAALAPVAIPEGWRWRFGVVGSEGIDVLSRGDDAPPGIVLHDVAGLGTIGGRLASLAIGRALIGELGGRRPAAALTGVNRRIRAVGLPEGAVVSATAAEFVEERENRVWLSTAGFPAPVLVRPNSPAEVWLGSGPFLGATDTKFAESSATLAPGEKLVILGRGAADLRPDVRDIADRHRHLEAQPLADAIAAGLGVTGITLIVAERKGS